MTEKERLMVYDTDLINRVNAHVRMLQPSIEDVCIFVDLDNTIYKWCDRGQDKKAQKLSMVEEYYYQLPLFQGARAFVERIFDVCPNTYILSKYPRQGADMEKKRALHRDMPFIPDEHMIFIPLEVDKGEIMKTIANGRVSLVIDDYHENITSAYQQGFVGIKKTYSGKNRPCYQIKDYSDFFIVAKKLGICIPEYV